MRKSVEFEDIEEMRRQEGIEDAELWEEIGGLHAGDSVKLTLVTTSKAVETVLVRITSVRGLEYRGKLTHKPTSAELAELKAGSQLSFKAAHIHSVVKEPPEQKPG